METVIKLREEYIKLGQALKAAGLVDSGVDAKFVINDGMVSVNGHPGFRKDHGFPLRLQRHHHRSPV